MRKLLSNQQGNVGTIVLAVATAITIAVSILIVYSILGGMSTSTIDAQLASRLGMNATTYKPAGNATKSLIAGLGTFFTISPIYLIVLVAVAIIGAVMGIMYVGKRQ
jgi:hypothetical protein